MKRKQTLAQDWKEEAMRLRDQCDENREREDELLRQLMQANEVIGQLVLQALKNGRIEIK